VANKDLKGMLVSMDRKATTAFKVRRDLRVNLETMVYKDPWVHAVVLRDPTDHKERLDLKEILVNEDHKEIKVIQESKDEWDLKEILAKRVHREIAGFKEMRVYKDMLDLKERRVHREIADYKELMEYKVEKGFKEREAHRVISVFKDISGYKEKKDHKEIMVCRDLSVFVLALPYVLRKLMMQLSLKLVHVIIIRLLLHLLMVQKQFM
jgi:hypothetical protein